jgi:hypothetical protein
MGSMALAADPAPVQDKPTAILQGRPDAKVLTDDQLGPEFRSLAAGIAFRPPISGKEIRRAVSGDEVVQYVYEKEKWQLKVTRMALAKGAPLLTDTDKDKNGVIRQGLLETMTQQLKVDTGGAEILRQDPINVGSTPVGMIAARYNVGTETRLTQRAIVQGDDQEQLYFVIDFTTPAPRTGKLDDDPATARLVELFGHVVESIQVLDQSQLIRDQQNRLMYSKVVLVNITEPKMRAALKPERWMRLIKDGKDIGYSYIVEEVASGLPHKGEAPVIHGGNVAGIRVGVRTRTFPDTGIQVDAQSWSWVAMDKKQEEWASVLQIENANAKDAKQKKTTTTEAGVAVWRTKPVKDVLAQAPDNRGIRLTEDYKLNVTTASSTAGLSDPIAKDLPPFYLPKALDHLLPRLLPLREYRDPRDPAPEQKGFMFATYVGDQKEIVRKYIDVGKEGEYTLAGHKIHGVPVKDRIGLEGSVSTHYMSPEGEYLGSVNEDSKVAIIPTDAATLQKMWKDVNLARPEDVEAPGSAQSK